MYNSSPWSTWTYWGTANFTTVYLWVMQWLIKIISASHSINNPAVSEKFIGSNYEGLMQCITEFKKKKNNQQQKARSSSLNIYIKLQNIYFICWLQITVIYRILDSSLHNIAVNSSVRKKIQLLGKSSNSHTTKWLCFQFQLKLTQLQVSKTEILKHCQSILNFTTLLKHLTVLERMNLDATKHVHGAT